MKMIKMHFMKLSNNYYKMRKYIMERMRITHIADHPIVVNPAHMHISKAKWTRRLYIFEYTV